MGETKARLYKRETLDTKLAELLNRVENLNSEKEHEEFICDVDELILFGSYVSTNNNKLHDLDVGIKLKIKNKHRNDKLNDKITEASKRAPYSVDYITQLYWYQEEVLRYLKNKSSIYSFHPLDMEEERKIIESGVHKTLVNNGSIVRGK